MTDQPFDIGYVPGSASAPETPRPAEVEPPLDRSIYRFILRYSLTEQIWVLALTGLSMPFYYESLELPKIIVNAINGKRIPTTFLGFNVDQISYLMAMCMVFLILVIVNGGFKYWINVLKGRLGERMLRRLRYKLYHRILRFPLVQFKRTSPGELIPMITSEVEPLGGFIGDAFVLPAQQGGTLITLIAFLFLQDAVMGLAAIALYPVQAYVIPKLQRRVNQLGKQRVRTVRTLAERIGESVGAITEVHANDGARLQLADFADRLGTIYDIRFEIYQRKFFVKFLNNFINQLTPFFFFTIGGYLVIANKMSFGSLVAVIAAYKDLAAPWKELLDFYQVKEDSRIKYEQVVEQFELGGMIDVGLQLAEPAEVPPLTGSLTLVRLTYFEDPRARLVDEVSAEVPLDRHLAVLGTPGSGKNELAMLVARLLTPSSGRIQWGAQDLNQLPYAVTGRRIAYIGPAGGVLGGTIADNLVLGLRQRPLAPAPAEDPAAAKRRQRRRIEARRSGNIEAALSDDWIDYGRAGVSDPGGLVQAMQHALEVVTLDQDVYLLGLRGRLDPTARPALAAALVEARQSLATAPELAGLVDRLDPARYNAHMTLSDNLLFGMPLDEQFAPAALPDHPYVAGVLDRTGLTEPLLEVGRKAAETLVEILADLPQGHEFFDQFGLISFEELPDYRSILSRVGEGGAVKPEDRRRLLALSFKLVDSRHRLDLIDDSLRARIIAARQVFAADLPAECRSHIELFEPDRFNGAASILENLLFGSVALDIANAVQRVQAVIDQRLDQLGLRSKVIECALEYQVGTAGARLSLVQRQKLALARAVMKRPDLLVLNEAMAVFDPVTLARVTAGLRAEFRGRGLLAVVQRASIAKSFDRVLVMDQGRLVEAGSPVELDRPGSLFTTLLKAEAA